jgi:hypothetical protein
LFTQRQVAQHLDGHDYYSEAFVSGGAQKASPPPSPSSKRPRKEDPVQRLQEGLSTPLTADNKGLQLLRLLGYKEGSGLGRGAHGIKEPLAVVKRGDRSGLGHAELRAERQAEAAQKRERLQRLRAEFEAKTRGNHLVSSTIRTGANQGFPVVV